MIPRHRSPRRRLPGFLFALLAITVPCAAHAQTVQGSTAQPPVADSERGIAGRVAEAGTGRPVAGATVTLVNERGHRVTSVVTDAAGGFHLSVPAPGRFQLRTQRVGYQGSVSQAMTVTPADMVRVELVVSTDAVVLAPLTVVASSRDVTRNSRLAAFEFRQQNNPWGRFLGPEQMARIRPLHASDALQQVAGVQIAGTPPVRQPTMRGRFGDRCMPTVYVDGMQIPAPSGREDSPDRQSPRLAPFARSFPTLSADGPSNAGVGLDEVVSGSDIVAVEVYDKPFEAPGEFGPAAAQINCGVIVIWTRQPGNRG